MDAQYWVSCNGSTLSKPLCLRFRKDYLGLIQRKSGAGEHCRTAKVVSV